MKKLNKKAFTVVELVIVIAVIAILAAVLIPTFVSLLRKSRISNDTSLVTNLNKALRAEKPVDKHINMSEALDTAEKYGYVVANLNAKAKDNEILWDSVNDAFCYLNDGKVEYSPETQGTHLEAGDYRLWKIYNTAPAVVEDKVQSAYSIYVANQAVADAINGKTVDVGVDCGKTEMTEVKYVSNVGRDLVIIRTNSYLTTLSIEAPSDVVYHYDKAGSVNIISSDEASYHENGVVPFLEVAGGHVVLSATAKVSAVHFTATNGVFKNTDQKTISIDLSKVAADNMPSFSRDNVTIEEQGTYVAKVTSSSDEYIWLWGNGTKTEMVVSASAGAIAESTGGGYQLKATITAGTEDGTVADQIANNAVFDPQTNEITYDVKTTKEEAKIALEEAVSKEVVDKATVDNADYTARIGGIGYNSWAEAYNAAVSGDTITLLKDIEVSSPTSLNKNLAINLGGKTITSSSILFNIYSNNDLTIKDSAGTGKINVTADKIVYSSGGGLVRLEGGALSVSGSSTYTYGIQVTSGSRFEMIGGSITIPETSTSKYNYCVSNSGSGYIKIYGGGLEIKDINASASGGNYAVASSSNGNIYMTDGYITANIGHVSSYPYVFAPYAIYNTGSGTAYISGGYIQANGDEDWYIYGNLIEGNAQVSGGLFGGVNYYPLTSAQLAAGCRRFANPDNATKNDYQEIIATSTILWLYGNEGVLASDSTKTRTGTYKIKDSSVAVSANPFVREGYTFTGWNTAADGTGISYEVGSSIVMNDTINLYAQWTAAE